MNDIKDTGLQLRRHERPVVVVADLIINDMSVDRILDGIASVTEAQRWQLRELGMSNMEIPTNPPPIGAIVGPNSARYPMLDALSASGIPIVLVNGDTSSDQHVVCADRRAAGRIAAKHFAELGFRDVGYIGQSEWSSALTVYLGFAEGADANGLSLHLLRLEEDPSLPEGTDDMSYGAKLAREQNRAKQITRWLQEMPKPIGILAYHDQFASRLCAIVQSAGLSIPEDVAILGLNNTVPICEFAPVPLSSIDQDFFELGRQAALLLGAVIHDHRVAVTNVMIPPLGIVERRSTNILAIKDPRAARALRFLWDNLDVQLSVDDVAQEVNVSRSTLERMFRKHLGRGVNAELKRKRLELCCQLLRTTRMTFDDITHAVGFLSVPYLYRTFRDRFGMTPNAYRTQKMADDS